VDVDPDTGSLRSLPPDYNGNGAHPQLTLARPLASSYVGTP
jgi:hypothetical protein